MKIALVFILICATLLLASCSQGPKTSAKFSFKLSFALSDSDIAQRKIKLFASRPGETKLFDVTGSEITLTLPVGLWNFYSVEWNGSQPYTGAMRCGVSSPLELKSGVDATVDFQQTEAQCGNPFFKQYFDNYCFETPASTPYPYFRSGDGTTALTAYEICTIDQLNNISAHFSESTTASFTIKSSFYKLARDLNFHAKFLDIPDALSFSMIGEDIVSKPMNPSFMFSGVFDGQGHSIKGMSIIIPETISSSQQVTHVGFIRWMYNGTLKNINFYVPEVERDSSSGTLTTAGVVVGSMSNSTLDNVHVFYGRIRGMEYIGGLAGSAMTSNTITNSSFTNGEISSRGVSGGLIGYATGLILDKSSSSGYLRYDGPSSNIAGDFGGLIGKSETSLTISKSFSSMNVIANNSVGGLVGTALTATITDSYSTGDLTTWGGNYPYVGGIVGWGGPLTLENTFHTLGGISSTYPGASRRVLVGSAYAQVNCINSFGTTVNSETLDGCTTLSNSATKTYDEIRAIGTFSSWSVQLGSVTSTSTWVMDDDLYDYPRLRWEAKRPCSGSMSGVVASGNGSLLSPFIVCTQQQFNYVANNPNYHYKLGRDIDLATTTVRTNLPITSLGGSLDGAGYTLNNALIEVSAGPAALIGLIQTGAVVKNLKLRNVQVKSLTSSASGLVVTNNGTIENVSAQTGMIKAIHDVDGKAAALANTNAGTIQYSRSQIQLEGRTAGGLVNHNSGTVYRSSSYGSITATSTSATSLGGLVAYNAGVISESMSGAHIFVSSLTATASEIGGLVGNNQAVIVNSFAQGFLNIMATATVTHVGGLAGYDGSTGNITYSFASVSASTTSATDYTWGAFVGGVPAAKTFDSTNRLIEETSGSIWDTFTGSSTNSSTTVQALPRGTGANSSGDIAMYSTWNISTSKMAEDDTTVIWMLKDDRPDLAHVHGGDDDYRGLDFYKVILGF